MQGHVHVEWTHNTRTWHAVSSLSNMLLVGVGALLQRERRAL
jgi:hypothetical protein